MNALNLEIALLALVTSNFCESASQYNIFAAYMY